MILNSPIISGSLTVTGNIIASGSITLSGSVASASFAATASFVALAQSASYVLTAQTASFVANAQTASFVALAQSASNAVAAATASFANAFTVASTLTAQTLVVQTITSSVVYSSGSNIFGNDIGNTQTFTGSVNITGSIGVGTNLPTALLHLSSSTSTAAHIHSTGTANYASLNLTNTTTGYGYDVGMGGSTSIAPNCFYIYGGATASVKLAVASNGNIGIGTVIPSASLEVSGKVYVGGNTSNSNYQFLVKRGTDRNMGIGLQGTDLSIEFVNDIYTANVPTRIYANPLVLLGGQVLIGTATAIFNSQVNINYNQSTYEGLAISTDKAYNSSPQPNLIFGGKYNSSGDYRQYATIQSYKDNATNSDSAASLVFYTNGNSASVTERMRITSGGNIAIGTTSTNTNVKLKVKASSEGTDIGLSSSTLCVARTATDTQLNIGYYSTPDAFVISSTYGSDGAYKPLAFATSDTERMRITSTYGAVLLGTTTNESNTRLQVAASQNTTSNWISATFAGPGTTDKVVIGNYGSTGASIGGHTSALSGWASLSLNFGGGGVYAGTLRIDNNSDQRFKRNITSVENALDTILKLQGRKFNMIDENNILRYGFVAQEVQPHLSDFVTESIREHKDENVHITNLLTLETSGAAWAALLVEAIKELQAQITELKNK